MRFIFLPVLATVLFPLLSQAASINMTGQPFRCESRFDAGGEGYSLLNPVLTLENETLTVSLTSGFVSCVASGDRVQEVLTGPAAGSVLIMEHERFGSLTQRTVPLQPLFAQTASASFTLTELLGSNAHDKVMRGEGVQREIYIVFGKPKEWTKEGSTRAQDYSWSSGTFRVKFQLTQGKAELLSQGFIR